MRCRGRLVTSTGLPQVIVVDDVASVLTRSTDGRGLPSSRTAGQRRRRSLHLQGARDLPLSEIPLPVDLLGERRISGADVGYWVLPRSALWCSGTSWFSLTGTTARPGARRRAGFRGMPRSGRLAQSVPGGTPVPSLKMVRWSPFRRRSSVVLRGRRLAGRWGSRRRRCAAAHGAARHAAESDAGIPARKRAADSPARSLLPATIRRRVGMGHLVDQRLG